MYCLRKWYFDLLTRDREYAFVYCATLRLGPFVARSLTIHLADPARASTQTRTITVPSLAEEAGGPDSLLLRLPSGAVTVSPAECQLDLEAEGCTVHLLYSAAEGRTWEPVCIPAAPSGRILWKPIGLRYAVTGGIAIGPQILAVRKADGYADYLESTLLPPFVPVRSLYWGRLHHPDLDLVLMRASGRGPASWSAACGTSGGRAFQASALSVVNGTPVGPGAPAMEYTAAANTGCDGLTVKVRRTAVVQTASFLNAETISSASLRSLLKLITRDPRSMKFLSQAEVTLDDGRSGMSLRGVPMIDEQAYL